MCGAMRRHGTAVRFRAATGAVRLIENKALSFDLRRGEDRASTRFREKRYDSPSNADAQG
jgi:hypothetical protein